MAELDHDPALLCTQEDFSYTQFSFGFLICIDASWRGFVCKGQYGCIDGVIHVAFTGQEVTQEWMNQHGLQTCVWEAT